MSEMLKLRQLHFTLKHWRANVADNTLDAAEVKEVLEDACERKKDMNIIRRFVRETAGPGLQTRLMAAQGWYVPCEDSDRATSIINLYQSWLEDTYPCEEYDERIHGPRHEDSTFEQTYDEYIIEQVLERERQTGSRNGGNLTSFEAFVREQLHHS